MAEKSPEPPESELPVGRSLPPRRPIPIGRAKPTPAAEEPVPASADRPERLDGFDAPGVDLEEEYGVDASSPGTMVPPIRSKRFTRTGTVNGEGTLIELLQGVVPTSATPVPSDPAAHDVNDAAPLAPRPVSPANADLPPRISAVLHQRRLKLVIAASQIFGLILLVLGFGLGWLIFSAGTPAHSVASAGETPTTDNGTSPDSKSPKAAVPDASDPLIVATDSALKAEREGDLPGAARVYDEMRHKGMNLAGLNYQQGILAMHQGDLNGADLFLLRSIQNGENVAASYYVRATFAGSKGDYVTAARSFQAATRNEPFSCRPFFYWGECLRRDGHPLAAIARFDQALLRACPPLEAEYIRFKRNLALIETGNDSKFAAEIADKTRQPTVTGDWLLLAAADDLNRGAFVDGADHLRRAEQGLPPNEFSDKVADYLFQTERRRPQLAPIFAAVKANVPPAGSTNSNSQNAAPGPDASFTDPAGWTIQEADPATWPSPRVVLSH